MTWEILIPIIAKFGLDFAELLMKKYSTGNPPTLADLQELKALTEKKARDLLLARLAAAGIDPASPQGQILLGMAG